VSNIIYAPTSWNPISGCSPVSEGCANCWAKSMARRQRQEWGTVHLRDQRVLGQPLHWRKPRTVAVAFMGDLFHDQVPDEFIMQIWDYTFRLLPQHTFMVLTKRPERMQYWVKNWWRKLDPLPNVWLGVSCENQARADERIPLLLDTPAAHRWISCEPLLGPIDLIGPVGLTFPLQICRHCMGGTVEATCEDKYGNCASCHGQCSGGSRLDWIVCGGESGPHARPCNLGWIRDIRDQCKAAGVPCYVKQMGANPRLPTGGSYWNYYTQDYAAYKRRDRKGENPDEWPADLRVREMPEGSE